jgi:hypothetical protein
MPKGAIEIKSDFLLYEFAEVFDKLNAEAKSYA